MSASGASGLWTNALIATEAALRKLPRLNLIIVTRNVPAKTTSNDGVLTKVLADPPRKIDARMTAKAPISPMSVAKSKGRLSVDGRACRQQSLPRARGL